MKKLLIILFIFCASTARGADAPVPVSVDPVVEFVSAACRTAGFEEYVHDANAVYASAVDSLFRPFRNHPAIDYLNSVRGSSGIGYDAVAALAVQLEDVNGALRLRPGTDLPAMDSRWNPGQAEALALLLSDLYRQSGFGEFCKSRATFYEAVVRNMHSLLEKTDMEWLHDFFGKKLEGSRVVISLLNFGNYGMTRKSAGRPDEAVIIVGCFATDDNGIPVFDGRESLIIHESSHPMCNPLVERSLPLFNDNINEAAGLMAEPLARMSYAGGPTMMRESMVRATEIQYALEHGDSIGASDKRARQMANGFLFMPEILAAFEMYEADRQAYPVIDSIMPVIVEAINEVDVRARYGEIMSASPEITGCSLPYGATVSPSDSLAISFYFSRPIMRGSFGMGELEDKEVPDLSNVHKPRIALSDDGMTLTIYVEAKPEMEYGFTMHGSFYRGATGFPGRGSIPVLFRTTE
ncbi:MAG: DUF4932 domain-containing protein [Muribaculaceae bacterium]|nr:DUF4932 domain-containing protein [Muribaculaceae bacterium]